MNSTTLKLNQNKVTLPSFFRKRFKTKNFLAIDHGKELIIKPILEEELDNDLMGLFEALHDSLNGNVKKHRSPQEYLKKMKNAA